MQSIQNIKRRLKGVKNISQITKAMELVAATKMRRSQEIALASRPYAFAALEFLGNLSRLRAYSAEATSAAKAGQDDGGQALLEEGIPLPPLLQKRSVKRTVLVLVASDKGLAGSFNSAVIKEFEKHNANTANHYANDANIYIAVGQKAANYFQKKNLLVSRKFLRVGDFTAVEEVKSLAEFLINGYIHHDWDRVVVFSTHFRSALRQEPLRREVLPVDFESIRNMALEIVPETGRFSELRKEFAADSSGKNSIAKEYLIEPTPEIILEKLVSHLILMEIYHLILEANASEHAARRLAMKNASDNADELGLGLTLEYNKSRQAAITREIIEVTSGAEALT